MSVAVLSALFVMSFVDRMVLALMVDAIRTDLTVSDVQIGLLIGTSFAIFYSISGLPIARIADRGNRRRLIMAGALAWGLSTSAAAFADNYGTLLLLRVGVALGEAALTPAVMSLLGDMFAPNKRALPASIYTMIGVSGGSVAMLIGGAVLQLVSNDAQWLPVALHGVAPWRLTLFFVGMPTVALVFLIPLVIQEPPRSDAIAQKPGLRDVVAHIGENKVTYAGFLGGTALLSMVNYSVLAWYATYLIRTFGLSASDAGFLFGLIGLGASVAGGLCLPLASEALLRRGVFDAPLRVALLCIGVSTPLIVISFISSTPSLAVSLAAVALFFMLGPGILMAATATILAPGRIRAQMVALYHIVLSLIGFGLGPTIVAMISRSFFQGQGIGQALAVMSAVCGLLNFALLFWSRRPFARTFKHALAS